MERPGKLRSTIFESNSRAATTVAAFLFCMLLSVDGAQLAQGQTHSYKLLHSFTGGEDSASPVAGLAMDSAGNLYGTTAGIPDWWPWPPCNASSPNGACGTVFQLKPTASGWSFSTLYRFQGGPDGWIPPSYNGLNFAAPLTVGPDGSLYGTTWAGGDESACIHGCGTVFKLTRSADDSWSETVIYRFSGRGGDGCFPGNGAVVFDHAGNLYGTTYQCGPGPDGPSAVYKLTPGSPTWTETVIYTFADTCSTNVWAGVVMDNAGNLYGTTLNMAYELTPSGGEWTGKVLHCFTGLDGFNVYAGLAVDGRGNVYGATSADTLAGGGTVFSLTSSGEEWNFATIHNWLGDTEFPGGGPVWNLAVDSEGNLYGTAEGEQSTSWSPSAFKLTPQLNGGWAYTDLQIFAGAEDISGLILDPQGNLYGTLEYGGDYGYGAVFEITP